MEDLKDYIDRQKSSAVVIPVGDVLAYKGPQKDYVK